MTVKENEYLFDGDTFISKEIQDQLPTHYVIRPLKRNDHQFGFISLLSELSVVGNITPKLFQGNNKKIKNDAK